MMNLGRGRGGRESDRERKIGQEKSRRDLAEERVAMSGVPVAVLSHRHLLFGVFLFNLSHFC
jgi:hypothetical protein